MSNRLTRTAYNSRTPFDIDQLAREIARWGRSAKAMPPSFNGCGARIVMKGPSGEHIGHMLPGSGVEIACDLRDLGITRPIPWVVDRQITARAQDWIDRRAQRLLRRFGVVPDPLAAALWLKKRHPFWAGEVGTITSYDDIIAARAGGKSNDIWVGKASLTTTATDWYAVLRATGTPGAMAFNSTTAPTQTATNRATTGAWSTGLWNPTGGDKKYLLTFGMNAGQQINFAYLVDVHVQGGSYRLTVATAETVASPVTIARNYFPGGPLGAGCFMVGVVTTGSSATACTLTVTYVDQDGNTGITTTVANPATAGIADQLWPDSSSAAIAMPFWPLASGDYGVRSMSQTQNSVGLAAGVLAVLLVTPLVAMPGVVAGTYLERDSTVQIDGLTELVTDGGTLGCLGLLALANTTSLGANSYFMRTVSG